MNELLVSAHLTLWLCLAVLGGLVLALRAQIGAVHARVAPAGALMVNELLRTGSDAPTIAVETLDGHGIQVGGPRVRSLMLLFVAPDCPVSRALLPVVRSLRRAEPDVDWLVASDGGEVAVHRRFLQEAGLDGIDYALSEALGRAYGIAKIPYAVLIDPSGTIAAMGIVNSREHLESLYEARERGVASIQDYLHDNPPRVDAVAHYHPGEEQR